MISRHNDAIYNKKPTICKGYSKLLVKLTGIQVAKPIIKIPTKTNKLPAAAIAEIFSFRINTDRMKTVIYMQPDKIGTRYVKLYLVMSTIKIIKLAIYENKPNIDI
jgi:hypothetical protein